MNIVFHFCCWSCGCAFLIAMGGCANAISVTNNFQNNVAWASSQQARVIVAGTICDPQGNLLQNVEITSHYVYLCPTGSDLPRAQTIRESRSEPANGIFRMIFSYAEEVHVRFSKEGYRDATIDLAVQPRTDIDDSLGRYPRAAEVKEDQLNIVLYPSNSTTQPTTAPQVR
jgi:hypothetical protein